MTSSLVCSWYLIQLDIDIHLPTYTPTYTYTYTYLTPIPHLSTPTPTPTPTSSPTCPKAGPSDLPPKGGQSGHPVPPQKLPFLWARPWHSLPPPGRWKEGAQVLAQRQGSWRLPGLQPSDKWHDVFGHCHYPPVLYQLSPKAPSVYL